MTDLLLAGRHRPAVWPWSTTPLLISWLRVRGIGQQIREDGPVRHLTKAGTPTMGGVAIIGAAVIGYLVEHVEGTFTVRGLVAMLTVCAAAGLGLADDWIKVHRQRSLGLNKRAKLAGQLLISITFAVLCVTWLKVDTHLSFTRYNSTGIDLGKVGWVIVAVLLIVGLQQCRQPHRWPRRAGGRVGDLRVCRLHRHRLLPASPPRHLPQPGRPGRGGHRRPP